MTQYDKRWGLRSTMTLREESGTQSQFEFKQMVQVPVRIPIQGIRITFIIDLTYHVVTWVKNLCYL